MYQDRNIIVHSFCIQLEKKKKNIKLPKIFLNKNLRLHFIDGYRLSKNENS